MKPKDLKFPYNWSERRPLLGDQIFFIPKYYSDHQSSHLPAFGDLFGNDYPVKIEHCSGNGSWIIDRAERDPLSNYVAVERRFDRVRKIWSKLKNRGLKNLFVVAGDAVTLMQHHLRSASVQEIFINFPDPFPKRAQAKHRLMQPSFIDEIERVLKPASAFTFVTDELNYMQSTVEGLLSRSAFKPSFEPPHFRENLEGYGSSYFDSLWRGKGRKIFYFRCSRI